MLNDDGVATATICTNVFSTRYDNFVHAQIVSILGFNRLIDDLVSTILGIVSRVLDESFVLPFMRMVPRAMGSFGGLTPASKPSPKLREQRSTDYQGQKVG